MIEEIISKYESFSDSLITKICYERSSNDDGKIEILIRAMNALNNYEFELIKLTLCEVSEFRLIENFPFSSLVVNAALLVKLDGFLIFDFFPDVFKDGNKLNLKSDFIVKFKSIQYEVL